MLPSLVGRTDLPGAISLNSTQVNLSRVIGPAIAGVLYPIVGPSWIFVTNAVTYLFVVGRAAVGPLPGRAPERQQGVGQPGARPARGAQQPGGRTHPRDPADLLLLLPAVHRALPGHRRRRPRPRHRHLRLRRCSTPASASARPSGRCRSAPSWPAPTRPSSRGSACSASPCAVSCSVCCGRRRIAYRRRLRARRGLLRHDHGDDDRAAGDAHRRGAGPRHGAVVHGLRRHGAAGRPGVRPAARRHQQHRPAVDRRWRRARCWRGGATCPPRSPARTARRWPECCAPSGPPRPPCSASSSARPGARARPARLDADARRLRPGARRPRRPRPRPARLRRRLARAPAAHGAAGYAEAVAPALDACAPGVVVRRPLLRRPGRRAPRRQPPRAGRRAGADRRPPPRDAARRRAAPTASLPRSCAGSTAGAW